MFKLNYFSLKEDFEELKNSALKRDKALAGGKVLVKGVANLGIFALTEMPVEAARQVLRSDKATPEQKERARQIIEKFQSK